MSTAFEKGVEMTSTAIPSSRSGRRSPARRALVASALVGSVALLAVGARVAVDRATGVGGKPTPAVATWNPGPTPLPRLEARDLQQQLVAAGYSLRVDGMLDPVTKSALADSLRPSSGHPLSRSLAGALVRTVLTGRRDPAAWNQRFGLHRRTRFVERPLTGAGGQLDAYGNLR